VDCAVIAAADLGALRGRFATVPVVLVGAADVAALSAALGDGAVFGHVLDGDASALRVAVARALLARTQAERRVLDERRRMTLMVESMADGVIMTDERIEVFLINPSARRLLGVETGVAVTAKYLKEKLGFYPFDLVARAHSAREELKVGDKTLHSIVSPMPDR